MSVPTKKLYLLICVAALTLAGCSKTPVRPDPNMTAMGMGANSGMDNSALNPIGVDTTMGGLVEQGSTLVVRDGYYEDDETIRGLLEPVYFDFDSSGIKASERIKLEAAQTYLDSNPNYRLMLEGHCDWRGTAEYNLGLGERRAGAALQFMQTAGVAATRLETASKGDLEAIENGDATAMAQDRRVEFVILKQ